MVKHLVLFVSVLFVFGCKESLPPINFDEDLTLLKDTTYVLAEGDIPAAEDQTIVVEDLTGVRCSNCPKAAETAKNIKDQFGSKAVVIGIYPEEPKNLAFPYPGFPDLRTKVSQQVAADIFQFSNQLPGGGVNRRKFSGQTAINNSFNTWVNSSNIVDGEKSAINLSLDKRAVNDSTYELLGEFVFFGDVVGEPFVSIFLLENNIAHPQTTNTGTNNEYVHQHVLRSMYTPYNGSPLGLAVNEISRGVVVERGWEIVLPNNVIKDESSLVVMLNYNLPDNKEVLQCKEIKLK